MLDISIWLRLKPRLSLLTLAFTCGIAVGLLSLRWDFITGQASSWSVPTLDTVDLISSSSGFKYFIADQWRFPLLDMPLLGIGGISAYYTDMIPWMAIIFKILNVTSVNPFGWWILLCHGLIALAMVRVCMLMGVRSVLAVMAISILASSQPILQLNLQAPSLVAQCLIVFALELYVRRKQGSPWWVCEALLLPLAIGIQAYLCSMCAIILMTSVIHSWISDPRKSLKNGIPLAIGVALTILVIIILGIRPPRGLSAGREWGDVPLNLISPFWPRYSIVFNFNMDPFPIMHQYGRGWLGLSAICLIVVAFLMSGGKITAMRRNSSLVVMCILCTLYAITTRPWFGPFMLFDWYPPGMAPLFEIFRVSGRYFWIPVWIALVASCVVVSRHPRGGLILICFAVLQLLDTYPVRKAILDLGAYREAHFDHARFTREISEAKYLSLYPHYDCVMNSTIGVAELEIMGLISGLNIPSDSIRIARRGADCAEKTAEGESLSAPQGKMRVYVSVPDLPIYPPPPSFPAWTITCPSIPISGGGSMRLCIGKP